MTFQNSNVRFYVSLIASGEGRHRAHLLKCVRLLSTSQTDWRQSSDMLSDISFDILSGILCDISSDIQSDISSDILSDISCDNFSDILSDISSSNLSDIISDISCDIISDISSDILSDISPGIFLTFFLTYLLPVCLTFFLAYCLTFFLTFFLSFFLTYLLTLFLTFFLAYLLTFFLTFCLTFFLAIFLTFFLAFFLTSSDILSDKSTDISSDILSDISSDTLSDILPGISSDILSDISSNILPGILSGIFCDILSDISSDIISDILSDILSDISSDILSDISSDTLSDMLPGIYPDILSDILSDISSDILSDISSDTLSDMLPGIYPDILSDISSDILSRGWGPAGNTERRWSRLRSGREHWTWRLAVEDQQGTLDMAARGWGLTARRRGRTQGRLKEGRKEGKTGGEKWSISTFKLPNVQVQSFLGACPEINSPLNRWNISLFGNDLVFLVLFSVNTETSMKNRRETKRNIWRELPRSPGWVFTANGSPKNRRFFWRKSSEPSKPPWLWGSKFKIWSFKSCTTCKICWMLTGIYENRPLLNSPIWRQKGTIIQDLCFFTNLPGNFGESSNIFHPVHISSISTPLPSSTPGSSPWWCFCGWQPATAVTN